MIIIILNILIILNIIIIIINHFYYHHIPYFYHHDNNHSTIASTTTVAPIDDKYWVVDKLTLSESSRRFLQVILSQHKAWVLETSKFISTSSENIPTGKKAYVCYS